MRLLYRILSFLVISISLFLFIGYGWGAFCTIIQSSGLNGNIYTYYNLTAAQYLIYTLFTSLFALYFACSVTINLVRKNVVRLMNLLLCFLLFSGWLIACELYLQSRFVGKG